MFRNTKLGLIFLTIFFQLFNSAIAQNVENLKIENGKPIERQLRGGETQDYSITLNSGHFLHLIANQRGIDVVLTLNGPNGQKLIEVDSPSGNQGPENIWLIIDTSGEHSLNVSSKEKIEKVGKYEVKIQELRPSTSQDISYIAAQKFVSEARSFMSQTNQIPPKELEETLQKALSKFREAIAQFIKAGSLIGEANTLQEIGFVNAQLGDELQVIEDWKKSLALYEKLGKKPHNLAINLGLAYRRRGNFNEAIEVFNRAYTFFEKDNNKFSMWAFLLQLGNVYRDQGDFKNSLAYYKKSLNLAETMPDPKNFIPSWHEVGSSYSHLGNYVMALEYQQKALAMYQSKGNEGGVASMLINIGFTYDLQNNLDLASDYFQKAYVIFEKIKASGGMGTALLGIGEIYQKKEDYSQALIFLEKALKAFETINWNSRIATTKVSIGRVYLKQGNNNQALENFKKSLEVFEKLPEKAIIAETLNEISNVYILQGNYELALDFAKRATDISKQTGVLDILWQSHINEGKAYNVLKQPVEAQQSFNYGIEVVEVLRSQVSGGEQQKQNFLGDKISPYKEMVKLLFSQRKFNEAFSFAERAKARTLLDVLQNGKVSFTKTMSDAEQEQEQRLKNEMVSLNSQLSKENERPKPDQNRLTALQNQLQTKRLEFEGFQAKLYASHPELKIQRGEMKPISLEEVAKLLPNSNSALIEYLVADDKTFLFVLTKESNQSAVSLKVFPIEIKQKDLAAQTESFRSKLAIGDLDFNKQAQDLYKLLLKPAEAQLKNKTNLIIVPDSSLWDLPFQALKTGQNKYLIESTSLSYTPSLTALREISKKTRNRSDSSATLLAFGNPDVGKETSNKINRVFMSEKLDPLPDAEKLVNSLGKMYGATKSKIFVGVQAQEETAKTESPKYRIVQFATHGILNDISPMYSHLVLSQNAANANEDGLLEAWEMKDLDLSADIVILSACETARGKFGNGEGVIGMSWSLFIAGAPSTVASQWKVESSSTTELMLEFHRQLLTGKNISKAEALRKASLKLLKTANFKHPSYWAGFVIIGDGL